VTSIKGKSAKGNNAVTATGIASVAHQTAMRTAIAATVQAVAFNPSGAGINSRIKNNAKPTIKPFF
jgi:hypothetical protein